MKRGVLMPEVALMFFAGREFCRRRSTAVFCAAALAAGWLGAWCSPLFQRCLIDALTQRDGAATVMGIALTAAALLLRRGGEGGGDYLRGILAISGTTTLKQRLFDHLLSLPVEAVNRRGAAALTHRFQIDADTVSGFYASGFFLFVSNLFKSSGALVLIWLCNPRAAAAATVVLPFFIWVVVGFRKRHYRLARRVAESNAGGRRLMHNYIERLTLIKTQSAEERASGRVDRRLRQLAALRIKYLRRERLFRILMQLIPGAVLVAVFLDGSWRIVAGGLSLGGLWAELGLLVLVFTPTRLACVSFLQLQSAAAALARIDELLRIVPEGGDGSGDGSGDAVATPAALRGEIDFDAVKFGYPDGTPLFSGLSLHVNAGETVVISGPSGSGKSTLLLLLLRLYEPLSGMIRIDGVPLGDYDSSWLRRRIGYIGQNSELLPGSLRDNLDREHRHGDKEVLAVLEAVGLGALAADGGLERRAVEENCGNFSTGERLRLALARELLRDVDLLLLDEATANLDPENEARVLALISRIFGDRSVILVSHRPVSGVGVRRLRLDSGVVSEL